MEFKTVDSEWEKKMKELENEAEENTVVIDPVKDKEYIEKWGLDCDTDPDADIDELLQDVTKE